MADWFTQNAPPAPQGGDWFAQNAPPSVAPAEPSPVAKAGSAFWEGIGGPQWAPIVKALGNPSLSNPDAPDALAAVWNMAKGLAAEPGRVWNELGNTGAAMLKGDPLGAAYHLAGSVPLFGAPAQQVAQDLQRGDPAAAVGHTGAIIAPLVAGPAAELAGPAIAATGRGLENRSQGSTRQPPAALSTPLQKWCHSASLASLFPSRSRWEPDLQARRPPRPSVCRVNSEELSARPRLSWRSPSAARAPRSPNARRRPPRRRKKRRSGRPRSPRALHYRRPQSSHPRQRYQFRARRSRRVCATGAAPVITATAARNRLATDAGRRGYQLRLRDSGRIPAR